MRDEATAGHELSNYLLASENVTLYVRMGVIPKWLMQDSCDNAQPQLYCFIFVGDGVTPPLLCCFGY